MVLSHDNSIIVSNAHDVSSAAFDGVLSFDYCLKFCIRENLTLYY